MVPELSLLLREEKCDPWDEEQRQAVWRVQGATDGDRGRPKQAKTGGAGETNTKMRKRLQIQRLHILQHSKFIQKRAQRSLNLDVVINSDSDSCRPKCQPDSLTTWLNSGPPSTEPTANCHHWNGFVFQGNIFTPYVYSCIFNNLECRL